MAMLSADAQKVFDGLMNSVVERNPGEREFHQAVHEVMYSLVPFTLKEPRYQRDKLLERLTEPDRTVIFRVVWEDDKGEVHVNRAWRVQFNNAIGAYKGGMRFHPSVTQSVLKFLGFEQVFKNSLTGLPMGGAKGGSNFDPKGKSDREVMRFCQALMTELQRHIGSNTDVPAGDIGVGAREVSYLFGQQKRLVNRFTGTITGKGLAFGGSLIRTEATGYGAVYFMQHMLRHVGEDLAGKRALISGSGNVAVYCAEKLIQCGAKVMTLSDSSGFIYDPDGMDAEKLAHVREIKEVQRGRIAAYASRYPRAEFHEGARPWGVPGELVFPCATQNEIDGHDAKTLVKGGCKAVSEGANMPSDLEAIAVFQDAGVLFGPGKAANAGGVAVSGLEQSQNAQRMSWTREEVDQKLQDIMANIHAQCVTYGESTSGRPVNYVDGANIGGFVKVADALLAYGVM